MKNEKYVLVLWPESQEYMELEGVVLDNRPDVVGPAAYFVPEKYIKA